MMKKSQIKDLREKYLLGLKVAPKEIEDERERRIFRAAAVYVLGQVLELPEIEDKEDE